MLHKPPLNVWPNIQQRLPKNAFNFTLKYLNNTLETGKNHSVWSIVQSSACSFCLEPETLQHIASSFNLYLEHVRYTWKHYSVLNFIAKTFSTLPDCSLYADLPALLSPSIIPGNSFRHDLILITKNTNNIL